jgi:hypothetical protein
MVEIKFRDSTISNFCDYIYSLAVTKLFYGMKQGPIQISIQKSEARIKRYYHEKYF